MPKINDLIADKAAKGEDWVSYEYFPPRSEQGVKNLEARFERASPASAPQPLRAPFFLSLRRPPCHAWLLTSSTRA